VPGGSPDGNGCGTLAGFRSSISCPSSICWKNRASLKKRLMSLASTSTSLVGMHMPNEPMTEICSRLDDYVERRTTLRELCRWVALGAWDSDAWTDARAISLANGVELALAEFSNGSGSQDDLRATLRELRARFGSIVLLGAEPSSAAGRTEQGNLTVPTEAVLGAPRWVIPVSAA